MKNFLILMAIAVFATSVSAARMQSLYTDRRAMRHGDLLTVLVQENAQANTTSSTNTKKRNSFGINNSQGRGSLRRIPMFEAGGDLGTEFDGSGATTRRGNLVARVTVNIDEVLDNGNLVISGSRVIMVNEEKEIISVSGIVRPQDIGSDNTILSQNIANAEIKYSGQGSASSAQRPGPIARFFNWLF
ncbi:MAG: flagellar basal body L-ring protein FlgH [Chitinivibrionia bacterium]|nr:flagellar basal body L-ring protein FlgH [Chitinivibrionia bacterium]